MKKEVGAKEIIRRLRLRPNVAEGGYFASTYVSPLQLKWPIGDSSAISERSLCSAIYYLLEHDEHSALHRVTGDMIYHFYRGEPVQMLLLHPDGKAEVFLLSSDPDSGGASLKVVPGGTWVGSRLLPGGAFALMGVTMAPGFDPQDYAIGERHELVRRYPQQASLIMELTRE